MDAGGRAGAHEALGRARLACGGVEEARRDADLRARRQRQIANPEERNASRPISTHPLWEDGRGLVEMIEPRRPTAAGRGEGRLQRADSGKIPNWTTRSLQNAAGNILEPQPAKEHLLGVPR